MSSANGRAKKELILKFGNKCFIEELGIRSKKEVEADLRRYKGKKQKEIMNELTYHHIKERFKGGKSTYENGAILRNINHIWFNNLPKDKQHELNELFQRYKRQFSFNIAAAEITTEGIKNTCLVKLEEPEEFITIPAYDITDKDMEKYQEYKRKRNERVFKKFERKEEYGR